MQIKEINASVIVLSALLISSFSTGFCQSENKFESWEGIFMDRFKVQVSWTDNTLHTISSADEQIHLEGSEEAVDINHNKMKVENIASHKPYEVGGKDSLTGNIKMFDGLTMIQNDIITDMKWDENVLTFYIPDKSTRFEGTRYECKNTIQGVFIFPDGSKHPVVLAKASGIHREDDQDQRREWILGTTFNPGQLKEDILLLRDTLFSTHPKIDQYITREDLEVKFDSMLRAANRDMTIAEFYSMVTPAITGIGCSHTGIRMPAGYLKELHDMGNYFPFDLFICDSRAWIISDHSNQKRITPGSEVISIDHIPIYKIIRTLLSYIPSDGDNKTTKYRELNKRFNDYFTLIDNAENYLIGYVEPDSQIKSMVEVPAISHEQLSDNNRLVESPGSLYLTIDLALNTAALRIGSFAFPDIDQYLNEIDSLFMFIRDQKIENLVLDLRDNPGGHPIFAAILFSYLATEDFVYFKRNMDVPEFEPLYNPMTFSENHFAGNCYVLVNGSCLSTTGHLISLLRYYRRAVFIGEEPGSWFSCNDNSLKVILPNTRLEVNVPRSTFQTAVVGYSMEDRFEIDYPVQNKVSDLINFRDPGMDKAKQLIRESYGKDPRSF